MDQPRKSMHLNEVTPGMTLAEDVLTLRGKLILPQGTVMTEAVLTVLTRYEVTEISVLLSDELATQENEAERQRHRERIAHLFRLHDDGAGDLLRQQLLRFRVGVTA
ncbi:MAG: hypothetical protein JSS58_09315 [Proteobacteria bacterium]|nr:hypothetical protein [Pseudomonadota bacterium]